MSKPMFDRVVQRVRRKRRAERRRGETAWLGLRSSGLVGWSIVIPTLLGILTGVAIDRRYPSAYSWTLMLMIAGLMLGCTQAWHWVEKERRAALGEEDEV